MNGGSLSSIPCIFDKIFMSKPPDYQKGVNINRCLVRIMHKSLDNHIPEPYGAQVQLSQASNATPCRAGDPHGNAPK